MVKCRKGKFNREEFLKRSHCLPRKHRFCVIYGAAFNRFRPLDGYPPTLTPFPVYTFPTRYLLPLHHPLYRLHHVAHTEAVLVQ
jgi:hypothetical protein